MGNGANNNTNNTFHQTLPNLGPSIHGESSHHPHTLSLPNIHGNNPNTMVPTQCNQYHMNQPQYQHVNHNMYNVNMPHGMQMVSPLNGNSHPPMQSFVSSAPSSNYQTIHVPLN